MEILYLRKDFREKGHCSLPSGQVIRCDFNLSTSVQKFTLNPVFLVSHFEHPLIADRSMSSPSYIVPSFDGFGFITCHSAFFFSGLYGPNTSGFQIIWPEHHWRDIHVSCRNAHLVHQNCYRMNFTCTWIYWMMRSTTSYQNAPKMTNMHWKCLCSKLCFMIKVALVVIIVHGHLSVSVCLCVCIYFTCTLPHSVSIVQ
jgi:hypothetical protein